MADDVVVGHPVAARALPWHEGELTVQRRVGEADIGVRTAGAIRREIPSVAAAFLAAQPLLVTAARDDAGKVWASLLVGDPGFLQVPDPMTLDIAARPAHTDPLHHVATGPLRLGTIAIEAATRRRVRLNGRARPVTIDGRPGLRLALDQVVSNCPKYIAARSHHGTPVGLGGAVRRGLRLDAADRRLLTGTDTAFLGTTDADGNADASHRGGPPGFISVEEGPRGGDLVVFGDYVGNSMYMTLGNIEVHPPTGLLVLDTQTGDTLQLTGSAEVDYDPSHAVAVPGATRLVRLHVEEVVRQPGITGLRWGSAEPSRFSPDVGDGTILR